MPVIGFLSSLHEQDSFALKQAFQSGLSLQGYKVKKWDVGSGAVPALGPTDVYIFARFANGVYDDLDGLASHLAGVADVQLIASGGGLVAAKAAERAVQQHALNIPTLFLSGRVKEADEPANEHQGKTKGGYLSTTKKALADHEARKLLRQLIGGNPIIFHLVNTRSVVNNDESKWTRIITATTTDELEQRFMTMPAEVEGLTVSADPFFNSNRQAIIELANTLFRKPVCYPFAEYVFEGGLVSKGPSLPDAYRQLGGWAGMLLTDPTLSSADLPDFRAKDQIAVNLTAASTLTARPAGLDAVVTSAGIVIGTYALAYRKKKVAKKPPKRKSAKK